MKRRKGIFGRSKDDKSKKAAQPRSIHQIEDAVPASEVLGESRRSVDSTNRKQEQPPSPLLVAKAARDAELSARSSLEASQHSVSSGTIFVAVNEDSIAGSLRSSRSIGSLASMDKSKPSPVMVGKYASHAGKGHEMSEMKLSSPAKENDELRSVMEESVNSQDFGTPFYLNYSLPPKMEPGLGRNSTSTSNRLPAVKYLVEDLFQLEGSDFIGGERLLRLMRSSLEMESREFHELEVLFTFDPEETFLSVKLYVESFHAYWNKLQSEYNSRHLNTIVSQKDDRGDVETGGSKDEENKTGEDSSEVMHVPESSFSGLSLEAWNELEQLCWEIYEHSMWCFAVLATVCVGPSWNLQLKERRARIQAVHYRNKANNESSSSQNEKQPKSTNSFASKATLARSNRQRMISFQEEAPVDLSGLKDSVIVENVGSLGNGYPYIAEHLPISMLRFAAWLGEEILPPVKYSDTKVVLTINATNEGDNNMKTDEFVISQYSDSIEQTIWEERRSLIRRQRVAEAQRELTAALISDDNDGDTESLFGDSSTATQSISSSVYRRYKLNIIGSHEPVTVMVSSWVETALIGWPQRASSDQMVEISECVDPNKSIQLTWGSFVTSGAIDWWNAFQVSKSVSDLTSAGWRPPPEGIHGEESMLGLMSLAERGILVHPKDMKSTSDFNDDENDFQQEEIREEILVAAAASAEATAALKHLGNRGCLPPATLNHITKLLCYLLSITDPSISGSPSSIFPSPSHLSSPEDQEKAEEEFLVFLRQRESCLYEMAELLWSMMARTVSMSLTVDALFDVANVSLSSKVFEDTDDSIFAACGAIRSLGASLWGSPPQINGNQSLRIYWSAYLDLLSEISSSIHERSACCLPPVPSSIGNSSSIYSIRYVKNEVENGSTIEDCFMTIPKINDSASMKYPSLMMIYEIVLSVRRLVDGDLASALDTLSLDEWGALISLLEMGLLPWLADLYAADSYASKISDNVSLPLDKNHNLIEKIEAEVADIFKQLKLFLGCNDDGSYVSQRIVDEEIRRKFYLLYLRMVSPISPASESVHIALSVIDSWVRGRPSTFNVLEWQKRCTKLLSEAFAFYDDKQYGYDGGYVHPPIVRQAAMRALVESDQNEQTENSSMSSPGTNSGDIDPHLLSRVTKNIHADTMCKILFPYLQEVLLGESNRVGLHLPNPYLATSQDGNYEELHHEEQKLILSALQIAGDLLRSPSVEKGERLRLLSIFRDCALHSSGIRNNPSSGLLGNILMLNDWGDICKFKLEAIRQISLFLKVSFESPMPTCTLDAVKVLVETVNNYYCNNHCPGARLPFQILCVSSLLTLGCLRVTKSRQGMLVDENVLLNSLPSETADFIDRIRFIMDIIASHENPDHTEILQGYGMFCPELYRGTAVSSIIKIHVASEDEPTEHAKSMSQSCTTINLGFVISAIKAILSNNNVQDRELDTLNDMPPYLNFIAEKCEDVESQLKIISYEILSYYIQNGLVGYPVQLWSEILPFITPEVNSVSQYKLLSSVAAFIADGDNFSQPDLLFNKLLSGCTSNNDISISNISCLGLSACFSALSQCQLKQTFSSWHEEACDALVSRIRVMIEKKERPLVPFMSALFHVLSTYNPSLHSISDRGKANIVILCHEVCSEQFNDGDSPQNYLLSLQCASSAISTMGIDELKNLIPHISERQDSFSLYEEKLDSHSNVQFTSVIMDLLVQHSLIRASSLKAVRQNLPEVEMNEVEIIAKDIEEIESFSLLDPQEHNFGAWLLNDILLVCRIGLLGSVHQGWVEIILRSPSTRIRKLIRLSNHISLPRPDLPSYLWETGNQNQSLNNNNKVQDGDIVYTADTRSVGYAKIALDCCKTVGNDVSFHRQASIHKSSTPSLRSFIHTPKKKILPKDSQSAKDTILSHDNSFSQFLHTVFAGNENNVKEVENVLCELDGSISILDSVSVLAEEPKILKWSSKLRRALNILDRTAFLQTHKIALLFTGPTFTEKNSSVRSNETRSTEMDMKDDNWILNVQNASPLFFQFCNGLGTLASLKHLRIFSGGMDTSDYASDGKFALCWIERNSDRATSSFIGKTMVLFHAVPLMPPGVNTRKRHVGNDFVHIVFCEESPIENGDDFGIQIISGEFCFVTILVIPICGNSMVTVTLKLKEDLDKNVKSNLTHLQGSIVMPFNACAVYVRQLAIRADLACRAALQDRLGLFSNWQERMQQIRSLQRYAVSS